MDWNIRSANNCNRVWNKNEPYHDIINSRINSRTINEEKIKSFTSKYSKKRKLFVVTQCSSIN